MRHAGFEILSYTVLCSSRIKLADSLSHRALKMAGLPVFKSLLPGPSSPATSSASSSVVEDELDGSRGAPVWMRYAPASASTANSHVCRYTVVIRMALLIKNPGPE